MSTVKKTAMYTVILLIAIFIFIFIISDGTIIMD